MRDHLSQFSRVQLTAVSRYHPSSSPATSSLVFPLTSVHNRHSITVFRIIAVGISFDASVYKKQYFDVMWYIFVSCDESTSMCFVSMCISELYFSQVLILVGYDRSNSLVFVWCYRSKISSHFLQLYISFMFILYFLFQFNLFRYHFFK